MPSPLTELQENRPPIRRNDVPIAKPRSGPFGGATIIEFGRFRVLLRQRVLLSETVPITLGTRAFDLLLVLLEADGALATKQELLSRVWPDVFVAEENLKVQISALRKALGEYRGFIRTDFGLGYRFTAVVRATDRWAACEAAALKRDRRRSGRRPFVRRTFRRSNHGW
jgi:DNA-binding winged helix-turn-helix (wHTH) protein